MNNGVIKVNKLKKPVWPCLCYQNIVTCWSQWLTVESTFVIKHTKNWKGTTEGTLSNVVHWKGDGHTTLFYLQNTGFVINACANLKAMKYWLKSLICCVFVSDKYALGLRDFSGNKVLTMTFILWHMRK